MMSFFVNAIDLVLQTVKEITKSHTIAAAS
jgi:hypothetical protein